ncbi:cytidine and deoxycytidylate deaminase zinc-binding domain protein [Aspergillus heteromorphus CBS 117.55]|uniref:Cytidine and deoxycytidylate deaminase zinc-binding domain protein n=1 Tax=Aspergillus heteromorphus CBS 117.55 TaxID=1448321 RepID=A0A317VL08_9EURO|nr:cytidine and deoxycytidylate deaminase zinc-binding domain protein [Aspergillus heteromorphus CBS 117.55]PWY75064.1 cytidine and deoxycytidylate deaminase zinc-binding domain protein [Aspergillus heteromorphus CBS 117.55]
MPPSHPTIEPGDHKAYMEYALTQAHKNEILSTGYSMELPGDRPGDPGNTHAEHCCFIKVADKHNFPEERIGQVLFPNTVLSTTMEPCNRRLSGNRTCVERILGLAGAIRVVHVGMKEPETFIGENVGIRRLRDAGVRVEVVDGMEERIVEVATAGH